MCYTLPPNGDPERFRVLASLSLEEKVHLLAEEAHRKKDEQDARVDAAWREGYADSFEPTFARVVF